MATTNNFGMDPGMYEAYQKYSTSTKTYDVENTRTRPPNQDIFDWLLEDKELIHETDRDLREAGVEW
jgi:hypothetical protein